MSFVILFVVLCAVIRMENRLHDLHTDIEITAAKIDVLMNSADCDISQLRLPDSLQKKVDKLLKRKKFDNAQQAVEEELLLSPEHAAQLLLAQKEKLLKE